MEKVLVTGGSGYIGLHCISQLLKEGFSVRTSLRSMDRKKEIQESLSELIKDDQTLEFCELDLMHDKGWDQAVSCLLYTSPSPRDLSTSRMPSSA